MPIVDKIDNYNFIIKKDPRKKPPQVHVEKKNGTRTTARVIFNYDGTIEINSKGRKKKFTEGELSEIEEIARQKYPSWCASWYNINPVDKREV